jgi:PAS domain S-box-containing protein
MTQKITPTQHELVMRDDDFIVTKTDSVGLITYCNPIFIEFSGFSEHELLGKQHNIVRHPDMPRAVFALLWQTIKSGDEFMGYVKNLSKCGAYYWVFATVTPSFKPNSKEIIGFFSVRRKPDKSKLRIIEPIYREMLTAEKSVGRGEAVAAGTAVLMNTLKPTGKDYREFVISL